MYSWHPRLKVCFRSFVSLLHTVSCPSGCLLTCSILRSGGEGLFRTQFQVITIEKCVFWVVAAPDPKMKTCRNMHWLRIEFVHKVHVCSFATPPWCMCQHTNRVKVNVYMWHSLHHVFTTLMFTSPLQLISYKSGFKNEFWCIRTSILIR